MFAAPFLLPHSRAATGVFSHAETMQHALMPASAGATPPQKDRQALAEDASTLEKPRWHGGGGSVTGPPSPLPPVARASSFETLSSPPTATAPQPPQGVAPAPQAPQSVAPQPQLLPTAPAAPLPVGLARCSTAHAAPPRRPSVVIMPPPPRCSTTSSLTALTPLCLTQMHHQPTDPLEAPRQLPPSLLGAASVAACAPEAMAGTAANAAPSVDVSTQWVRYETAEGVAYFHRSDRNETRWALPEGDDCSVCPTACGLRGTHLPSASAVDVAMPASAATMAAAAPPLDGAAASEAADSKTDLTSARLLGGGGGGGGDALVAPSTPHRPSSTVLAASALAPPSSRGSSVSLSPASVAPYFVAAPLDAPTSGAPGAPAANALYALSGGLLSTPPASPPSPGSTTAEAESEEADAVRMCSWLAPETRDALLSQLEERSDARLLADARDGAVDARRAQYGAEPAGGRADGRRGCGGELVPAGETVLVLPEKGLLLRPVSIGTALGHALGGNGGNGSNGGHGGHGNSGGLALEFESDGCCVTRLYACLPPLVRACVFVGDTILGIDDELVHSAAELLTLLDERPPGIPLRLRLYQPTLSEALRRSRTERVRYAAWVHLTPSARLPPPAPSGSGHGPRSPSSSSASSASFAFTSVTSPDAAARLRTILTLPDDGEDARSPAAHEAFGMLEAAEGGTAAPASAAAGAEAGGGGSMRSLGSPPSDRTHGGRGSGVSHAGDGSWGSVSSGWGGGGEGGAGMGVLVICGQRVRFVQLRVHGTRKGVLNPELVGKLEKQVGARKATDVGAARA